MGTDLDTKNAAKAVKTVGGDEQYLVDVSSDKELHIRDTHDNGGLDAVLALTTTAKLGVVNIDGVTPKANRKYFVMEALDAKVKWGFSNTTQSFDLFKSQLIMIPAGPGTEIWFSMSSGAGSVAIGEIS